MRAFVHAFLLLFFWWCAPALALDASALPQGGLSLTAYTAVLEDPDGAMDIAAARAREHDFRRSGGSSEALSFGYARSAYWLRLELANPTGRPLDRMIVIGNARLSDIRFYYSDHEQRTGSALPYATRIYPNRHYVFPVRLAPQTQQVFYLRIWSEGTKLIPLALWEPAAYAAHAQHDYLVQGAYFGAALAMLVFNLVLFINLRDSLYFLYVMFVALVMLALAATNGLAQEWLWPGASGRWPNAAATLGFSLSAGMLTLFMRRMIGTRTLVPRLDRVLLALMAFFFLSPVLSAFFYVQVAGKITAVWAVASPLIMWIGIVCAFKRQRSAYYFTAAFVGVFIGNASSSLAALGWLPPSTFSSYGTQIGSCIEMMVLAFALADRVHIMRREKASAQRDALAAQASLIVGLQQSERQLEARVEQRTRELQVANDHLEALSMTDGLTGIANRRRFDAVLDAEWARAARQQHPLAVGLLDIDYFKQYNDHYGHQQGDDCLRRVAALFKAQLQRGGDLVARYGGEEFAFIAPAVDAEQALAIADGICRALEALALPHEAAPRGVLTASIGIAAWTPLAGESPAALLEAADQALYRAKQLGRNRAEMH